MMRLTESSRCHTNIAFFFLLFLLLFFLVKLIKPLEGELIKVPAEEQRTKFRSSAQSFIIPVHCQRCTSLVWMRKITDRKLCGCVAPSRRHDPRPRVAMSAAPFQRCCLLFHGSFILEELSFHQCPFFCAAWKSPRLISVTCFSIKSEFIELSASSISEDGVSSQTNKHKAEVIKVQGCFSVERSVLLNK